MKKTNFYLIALIGFILSSCVSALYVPVSTGNIATEGVEIRAEDGSFTLKSGERWTPPFQNNFNNYSSYGIPNTNDYSLALQRGAKRVRLKVPYQSEELYGVLALHKAYDSK